MKNVERNRNTYLVKILIACNDYQKRIVTTVNANRKERAGAIAVLSESHNSLKKTDEGWFIEKDDSFAYFIESVTQLTPSDAEVFKKHGI